MADLQASQIGAVLFDVFGTVVDWRGSLIADLGAWGAARGIAADWAGLADAWRDAYAPSMDAVRRGEQPWTVLDDLHRASLQRLAPRFGLSGLTDADLDHVNRVWHRLSPWPDSVAGLRRLRERRIVAALSNGNVALLIDMAKHAGLPWDCIVSAELFGHYKPDPECYRGCARLLDLAPAELMLVAAHPSDLRAARAAGLRTAYVRRPLEQGAGTVLPAFEPEEFELVADDFGDLADRLAGAGD